MKSMEEQKSLQDKENKTRKRSLWSQQELNKLLEFLILNPHKVCLSPVGQQSINSLLNCVAPDKNYQQCQEKMEHLMTKHKSYDKVIDYLQNLMKANSKWIEQRKTTLKYFKIEKIQDQIKNIEEDFSFEEHARRLFISDFNFYEALMVDKAKNSTNQVSIFQPSVTQTKVQKIDLSIQKLEQEPEEHIVQLRYVLFMVKYKRQLAKENIKKMTTPIFQKMTNFIQAKYVQYWRKRYQRFIEMMKNVENVIEDSMQNLYVKRQELDQEIARIEAFYQEDLRKEMNAFMKNSQLKLESSQEEIDLVIQKIKQEVMKRVDSETQNKKSGKPQKQDCQNEQQGESSGEKLLKNKMAIKIPIILNLTSRKVQIETNLRQNMKQSSKIYQKASQSLKQQKSETRLSKKQQLQKKKNTKKSVLMEIPKQNSDLFMESDQDHQGVSSLIENGFTPHHIRNRQCNSDETPKKVNQQTFEKTASKNMIFAEQKSNSSENNGSEHPNQQTKRQLKVRAKNPPPGKLMWTISQRMKINAFLNLNEQKSYSKGISQKNELRKKLLKYIGTQKTQKTQRNYMNKGLSSNGFDLEKLIKSSRLSLDITKGFMWRCKELGDSYLQSCRLSNGSDELIIKVHPLLQPIPTQKKFEDQIERIIKRGPFLQAILESFPEKVQTEELTREKSSKNYSDELIEIQENLQFSINLTIPFGNSFHQKIEKHLILLLVEEGPLDEQKQQIN